MYMNLKPSQHKRIVFNTTTMTSLGFIGSPPKFNFLLRSPPQLFWSEIFRPPPLKLGGCYHVISQKTFKFIVFSLLGNAFADQKILGRDF